MHVLTGRTCTHRHRYESTLSCDAHMIGYVCTQAGEAPEAIFEPPIIHLSLMYTCRPIIRDSNTTQHIIILSYYTIDMYA